MSNLLSSRAYTRLAPFSLRRVFVKDLVLSCSIGVHAHELEARQRIRLNIDLRVYESDGAATDRLEDVVCYDEIITRVKALTSKGHISLIETLAEMIASTCLEDARIHSVQVQVEKLDVYQDAQSVGVEIRRPRSRAAGWEAV